MLRVFFSSRILGAAGGSVVRRATLGPAEAEEQLRDAMAIGVDAAIHLVSDGREWGPVATAAAIVDVLRAREAASGPFDLILFGNESADSGGFQVGIRVAHALGRPVVTGAKELRLEDGRAIVGKGVSSGLEVYEVPLPAIVTVKEGINLPRYPSVPGRLRARKKGIERVTPDWRPDPAADRVDLVCEGLDTGMVGLNQGLVSNAAAPFGGVKHSGIGREGGIHSFDFYADVKTVSRRL